MQTRSFLPLDRFVRAALGVAVAFAISVFPIGIAHALEPWQDELLREWSVDHPGETAPEIDWSTPLGTSVSDGGWSVEAPPLKYRHVAVYDPVRDRMIVFGGFSVAGPTGGVFNDVWCLSLAGTPTWTALAPVGTPPAPRYSASAIYDPVRDQVVVFGGQSNGGPAFTDVWTLSLGAIPTWKQLTTLAPIGGGPTPRSAHSAVYDPIRDRMIICGGLDSSSQNLGDVWTLSFKDSLRWTQIAPAGAIAARRGHSSMYDPIRDRMIVFGGIGDISTQLNDVMALSLAGTPTWTTLVPAGTPPPGRRYHSAIYDPVRDRMLVYGGCTNTDCYADAWALSLAGAGTWAQLTPAGNTPIFRFGHVAIYDPVRDRMLMYGGRDTTGISMLTGMMRADTWALNLAGSPNWVALPGLPRSAHSLVWDTLRDRAVVFGGNDGADLNDVWTRGLVGTTSWAPLAATGTPPSARQRHSAIYDVVRDRMVVFGGQDNLGTCNNELWQLSFSGVTPIWSALAPTGTPPDPREGHAAVYDRPRDRMLVFGGRRIQGATETLYDDVWALSLSTLAWTKLTPTGTSPGARHAHTAIIDVPRDRLVIFGGRNATNTVLSTAAVMSLGATPAWTALAPTGTPPVLANHVAVFDPVRGRMVVFGGWGGSPLAYRNETRALSLAGTPAWSTLAPAAAAGLPRARSDLAGFYDPRRDRLVTYGGYGSPPDRLGTLNDLWSLAWSAPLSVPVTGADELALSQPMPNPSRTGTRCAWTLPTAARVRVAIYDVSGRLVRTVADAEFPAGRGEATWNGNDASGAPAPAGLYFYRVESGGRAATRKVVLSH